MKKKKMVKKNMMRDTKAASILLMIFEIVAVILIVMTTKAVAEGYATSDKVQRAIVAEDIRMMVDTLVAVPGDALVQYPHNVTTFNFLLEREGIFVFKSDEAEALWTKRPFILPAGFSAETARGVVEHPSTLCLEKRSRKIVLRECPQEE